MVSSDRFVGAEHQFHDPSFARGWADRFVPTAPRLRLFDLICRELETRQLPVAHVVELGIGPGYMARYVLDRLPHITYEGIDFSEAMHAIARETIGAQTGRVTFTLADLLDGGWTEHLSRQPGAVISTWSLHDLGSQGAVADVYRGCAAVLPPGGLLVNGDFIEPQGTRHEFEAGRFSIDRHIELLEEAGFRDPRCLAHLEPNLEEPTPAENYACLMAER